jgi:hypothetical protein
MFSETSVLTRATQCNITKDIRLCYRRENVPENGILRPYIVLDCSSLILVAVLNETSYIIPFENAF